MTNKREKIVVVTRTEFLHSSVKVLLYSCYRSRCFAIRITELNIRAEPAPADQVILSENATIPKTADINMLVIRIDVTFDGGPISEARVNNICKGIAETIDSA